MALFWTRKEPKSVVIPPMRSRDELNKISASLTKIDHDLKIIDIAQEMGELEVTGSFQMPPRFSTSTGEK